MFELPGGDVSLAVNCRGLGLTWPADGAVGQVGRKAKLAAQGVMMGPSSY